MVHINPGSGVKTPLPTKCRYKKNEISIKYQGVPSRNFRDIHGGVGWLGVAKGIPFPHKKCFVQHPGANFSKLWLEFFSREIVIDVRSIVDEKEFRRAQ